MISVSLWTMKKYAYILIIGIFISACSQLQRAADLIVQPTARELYLRSLESVDIYQENWNKAFDEAKVSQLEAPIPFVIASQSYKDKAPALAYKVNLERGSIFKVVVEKSSDSSLVFIDLFAVMEGAIRSQKPLVSNDWQVDSISYTVERSGVYKVVIQPELSDSLKFSAKLFTQPSFVFPVSGKSNAAVGSLWGVARDGGKRSHEGVDIFANRGVPVIAAVDGYVSYAGSKGLGGKQVWLKNGLMGESLYYAHLDSVMVNEGARIKQGDTLGLVGNTGNARTTPPHLHFGIYTRSGAINPLPFIKHGTPPVSGQTLSVNKAITKRNKNQLRMGPDVKYTMLNEYSKDQDVTVLGKANTWYHIKIADSLEGFMSESLLKL